jgi:hypothetical protein
MDTKDLLDYIREHFGYDESARGLVYLKPTSRNTTNRIGQRVGSLHPFGYRAVKIKGRLWREHILVFLLFNNRLPVTELDHKNRDNSDNRIDNIREATRSENCANRSRWGTSSRYRGVHYHSRLKKWEAGIRVDGKRKYLGVFHKEIDAALAYDQAAREFFGNFAMTNFTKDK